MDDEWEEFQEMVVSVGEGDDIPEEEPANVAGAAWTGDAGAAVKEEEEAVPPPPPPPKAAKAFGARSLSIAHSIARSKRADMRRQLLREGMGEHCLLLLGAVAHLHHVERWTSRALSRQRWGFHGVVYRAPRNPSSLGTLPSNPHHPPSPLLPAWLDPTEPDPVLTDTSARKRRKKGAKQTVKRGAPQEAPKSVCPALLDQVSRIASIVDELPAVDTTSRTPEVWMETGIPTARKAEALLAALRAAGIPSRYVVGVDMSLDWVAWSREVGKYLEHAADAAMLGKAFDEGREKDKDKASPKRGRKRSKVEASNSPTPRPPTPPPAEPTEDLEGGIDEKVGSDGSGSEFSFEGNGGFIGGGELESEDGPLLVRTVDDVLAAEDMVLDESVECVRLALSPWTPESSPSLDPVAAVNRAVAVEEAKIRLSGLDHAFAVHTWVEVQLPNGWWVGVSASPAARLAAAQLPYIVALSEHGGLIDVTPRYATDFAKNIARRIDTVKIPKERVDPDELPPTYYLCDDRDDGESLVYPDRNWWRRTVRLLRGQDHPPLPEGDLLHRMMLKHPPPQFHKDLLTHPLYCAKSLLGKDEGLPPWAVMVAKVHQYEVYLSEDVMKLRSKTAWRRFGRLVREDAEAAKVVKVAAPGGVLKKTPEATMRSLYGVWQTVLISKAPTPPTNTSSVINVDEDEGDDECIEIDDGKGRKDGTFSVLDTPIPPGLTHVTGYQRLNSTCASLGIPYAKALVGFSRGGRHCHPKFDGVVIFEKHEELLRNTCSAAERSREEAASRKRHEQVVRRWEVLTVFVLNRARLHDEYLR
eukprot:Sspe_Gene.53352::Locus_29511_Transcript_1_1_Confidence_1.000_Length_2545::g.53352::m.53352/K10838/XPC; xeroderma pigmentosum group C-complementing protein